PILTSPTLANTVLTFSSGPGAVNGSSAVAEELQRIDVTSFGAAPAGLNISTVAMRDSTNGGDGFATLGEIDAPGSDLGIVKIDGDLGRISAGNSATALPAVQRLTVQSLGRFGTSTGAADLHSVITKSIGSLAVRGDVVGAFVDVTGGIGSISVGGSLLGGSVTNSGEISASGTIGKVSIGG